MVGPLCHVGAATINSPYPWKGILLGSQAQRTHQRQ
jgi:hypothetical protein